jgi:type II secretory pathway pseudopilin PulG
MGRKGYALLIAVVAINIFAILAMMARSIWETELQRDLEEELLFRARQYKSAIEFYIKKNNNLFPLSFKELYEKKFLRQLYSDPMTVSGKWAIVMASALGGKSDLLVVPDENLGEYINTSRIMGVCSTSDEEGFKIYRGKKKYSEWAVYVGEQVDKEMPKIKYVGKPGSESESKESEESSEKETREREATEGAGKEQPGESSERGKSGTYESPKE